MWALAPFGPSFFNYACHHYNTKKPTPPRGMDENRAAQTQYGFIIIRVECKTKRERLHY